METIGFETQGTDEFHIRNNADDNMYTKSYVQIVGTDEMDKLNTTSCYLY